MSEAPEPWSTRKIGCVTLAALGLLIAMIVTSDFSSEPIPQDTIPQETTSAFADDLKRMQDGDGTDLQSTDTAMSFEACVETIQRTAGEVGVAPVNIVETSTMRMVRFPLDHGSVLITCGDDKMVVTRSPHGG